MLLMTEANDPPRQKLHKLADVRIDHKLYTQEALAKASGVYKGYIVDAENGRPITRVNANKILDALRERGAVLSITDIDWKIKPTGRKPKSPKKKEGSK